MSAVIIDRPPATEYAAAFGRYVSRVPEADILGALGGQQDELSAALGKVRGDGERFRYADGKWSIREVVGHLVDSERVFGYRAMCFARGETEPLPGFDENAYVAGASFDECPLAELVEEFALVRSSHLALFRHLSPQAWGRIGAANRNPMSVRATAFVMVGHVRHHLAVLRDHYLPRL